MLDVIETNLLRIKDLAVLSSEQYNDASIGPYYSSIGSHVRHVLDIFACLIEGLDTNSVDLTRRIRGGDCETDSAVTLEYLNYVLREIAKLAKQPLSRELCLVDDLGNGKIAIPSTLGTVLFQAHSHAIHHFAIIGYLLYVKNILLPDSAFGYNPTTPINTKPQ